MRDDNRSLITTSNTQHKVVINHTVHPIDNCPAGAPSGLKVNSPLELAELSPSIYPSLSINNRNVDPAAVLRALLEKHNDAFGSLLPCLLLEQYHVVNDGLEGQGASKIITNTTT